jgi:hypothetical protein
MLEGGKEVIKSIYYDLKEGIPVVLIDVGQSTSNTSSHIRITLSRRVTVK